MNDTEILNWLQSNRCDVECGRLGDGDSWEVTPGTFNPAYTGSGDTLREAVIHAVESNK